MIIKRIKNSFNHNIPITIEEFWKQQIWIIIFGVLIAIPGMILQKSNARPESFVIYAILFVGIPAYIEFIFTVKRYRAVGIPVMWACLVFIPPLNILAFIMAVYDADDWYIKYLGNFLHVIKEDKNV